MGNFKTTSLGLLLLAALALAGCSSSTKPGDPAEPAFNVALFSAQSATITNPYFPLVPGTVHIYQAETEEGDLEIIVVEVLEGTRIVGGVECVIVRDRVFVDELLIEDTIDWYAQDMQGNVWYMGEEVVNYEYDDDGNVIATDNEGSWETGLDVAGVGSLAWPGIVMKVTFAIGDTYSQEIYPGEAEDMGQIVGINVPVTLSDGSIHTCLKTRDWNPLDPATVEFKYYSPGIGFVLEEKMGSTERLEFRGSFWLGAGSLPDFSQATFSNPSQITHPHLNFTSETTRTFATATEDGVETIIVELLGITRIVNGIECAVVRDRVFLNGLLIEDTHDWYAQDDSGNVWYMGEDVVNYEYDEDDNLIGTDSGGAWEAGVDGAEAGIIMWNMPALGQSYRQEFYEGEAEDMAVVVRSGVTVDLDNGMSYTNCRQTLEWSPLDPFALEYKFYAPGVGVVLELPLHVVERVEFFGAFDTSANSLPDIGAATFGNPTQITNTLLPFAPGDTFEYERDTEDGPELVLVEVLATTVTILGIECVEVRVQEFLDGVLQEDTNDWYAQDDDGNVWYMGESVINYEYDEDGNQTGTNNDGAWTAGVDGALPGILMFTTPLIGRSYQQEFYEDNAEDMGLIIATGVTVVLGDGTTYANCLQTLDWTPLEPGALEYKFYAPGVGVVKEQPFSEEDPVELTSAP